MPESLWQVNGKSLYRTEAAATAATAEIVRLRCQQVQGSRHIDTKVLLCLLENNSRLAVDYYNHLARGKNSDYVIKIEELKVEE